MANAVVDSHCHVSATWFEPVESLLAQMAAHAVEQAVLIQDIVEFDNDYQQACVRRYPGRFASVVCVDVEQPDAPQRLADLARAGATGVRLRQTARSPGDDPFLIWRAAARLGLVVSCAGRVPGYISDDFQALLAAVPDLPIVVEHLGRGTDPRAANGEVTDDQWRQLLDMAAGPHRNLYMRFHGLGEFCQRTLPPAGPDIFARPIPPWLDHIYASFGPERLMWGSDYPPVSAREGYGNALRLARAECARWGEQSLRLVFGDVARRLFFDR